MTNNSLKILSFNLNSIVDCNFKTIFIKEYIILFYKKIIKVRMKLCETKKKPLKNSKVPLPK
jgi:hypothetical protein